MEVWITPRVTDESVTGSQATAGRAGPWGSRITYLPDAIVRDIPANQVQHGSADGPHPAPAIHCVHRVHGDATSPDGLGFRQLHAERLQQRSPSRSTTINHGNDILREQPWKRRCRLCAQAECWHDGSSWTFDGSTRQLVIWQSLSTTTTDNHHARQRRAAAAVGVEATAGADADVSDLALRDVSHTWDAVTVSADGMTDAHTSARVLVGQSRPNLCVDSRGWSSRGALCCGSRVSGST